MPVARCQAGGQEGGIRNAAERGDNGAMKPAGMNGRSGGAERGRGEGGRSEGACRADATDPHAPPTIV